MKISGQELLALVAFITVSEKTLDLDMDNQIIKDALKVRNRAMDLLGTYDGKLGLEVAKILSRVGRSSGG